MTDISYDTFAQEIHFGAGSLASLPDVVEHRHWPRLLVCASPSIKTSGIIDELQALLPAPIAIEFPSVESHVQDYQLAEVLALVQTQPVDAIIGMGGGSPIGLAKAVSSNSGEQPLPIIAIPTTYAGSEMTPVFGVTHHDQEPPRKVTVRQPEIVPQVVIYDPELTLDLPPAVTAGTGINALAHCVEALYSTARNPLATAAALEGARRLFWALPDCFSDGDDMEARTKMLSGSHLAGTALATTKMGLHHGLCHVLGGSAGVAHGDANAIVLPHAIRFNAEAASAELANLACALDTATESDSNVQAIEKLIAVVEYLITKLELPMRLRDVGVQAEQVSSLATLALTRLRSYCK